MSSVAVTLPLKWRVWPGLARLWFRGDGLALLEAVLFGLLVDFWLIISFYWTQWVDGRLWWLTTIALVAWWGKGHWQSSRAEVLRALPYVVDEATQLDRLKEAQESLLRFDWAEAERLLRLMLVENPRDPLALLLLTKTFRFAGRLEDARAQLSRLKRLDEAFAWWPEIMSEAGHLEPEDLAAFGEVSSDDDSGEDDSSNEVSSERVSPVAESLEPGQDALIDQVFTEEAELESATTSPGNDSRNEWETEEISSMIKPQEDGPRSWACNDVPQELRDIDAPSFPLRVASQHANGAVKETGVATSFEENGLVSGLASDGIVQNDSESGQGTGVETGLQRGAGSERRSQSAKSSRRAA